MNRTTPKGELKQDIPRHQLSVSGSNLDRDYNKDVVPIVGKNAVNLRLKQNHQIGQKVFFDGYLEGVMQQIYESQSLHQFLTAEAQRELSCQGMRPPKFHTSMQQTNYGNDISRLQSKFNLVDDHDEYQSLTQQYQDQITLTAGRLRDKALKLVNGMVADVSSQLVADFMESTVGVFLKRLYNQGIHVKLGQVDAVKQVAVDAERRHLPLLFLPGHKSHMDYVVLSFALQKLGLAVPHVVAGDNLNIPLIGYLLRKSGAFFIKRQFGGDRLYQQVFKEYIECLLQRGYNLECFVEGTRSRTGKLMQPKFGVLKIVMDAILSGKVDDVVIVPVSVDYDKVIETETYVNELLGTPKEKESLVGLLEYAAGKFSAKLGRIDIRFAQPWSLKQFINEQCMKRSTSIALFSPLKNQDAQVLLLKTMGYRVLAAINGVCTITTSALVATVLLTLRGRGLGKQELCRRVDWIRREIILKGGRVTDFGHHDTDSVVTKALNVLSSLIGVRRELVEPVYFVQKRFELSLFRNQLMHLFINESIVCCAMYQTIKKGQTHRTISRTQLYRDVVFISQLLKLEFIYTPGTMDQNLDTTVQLLCERMVIEVVNGEGNLISIGGNTTRSDSTKSTYEYFVRLSDQERSIGRENFDFYCFLLWPFIESYWLATCGLFCIIPTPTLHGDHIRGMTESELMQKVQLFGKTLYYNGDLGYFESINKETLKNAFTRYQYMGIISAHKVVSAMLNAGGVEKTEIYYQVSPEYECGAIEFINQPMNVYRSAYKFSQQAGASVRNDVVTRDDSNMVQQSSNQRTKRDTGASSSHKKVYIKNDQQLKEKQRGSKLWEFVEGIGKFRREGKHRRDNEVTGKRTMRIARLIRMTISDQYQHEQKSSSSMSESLDPYNINSKL
ncbi:hypothetical protein MIR68_003135 [Amoeboaphelidium protococcarum]|nr:hypothetical protein MIR68_003135 [Amoeboaphelidium protococcarum]